MTAGAEQIRVEERGAVLGVTIDRPQRRNALDNATIDALRATLRTSDHAAIVLTGAGTRCFCAGSDLKAVAAMDQAGRVAHTMLGQRLMEELENHPALVIAAVEGHCVGGGFELALACDVRVAGSGAGFGLPEVTVGMAPAWGGTYRLTRIAGLGVAKAVALLGVRLGPVSAQRAGVVTEVVDEGLAYEHAMTLGARVAETTGREALTQAKALLNLAPHVDNGTGARLEALTEAVLASGGDYGRRD